MRVLADWCPPFPGYHLYYASRHQLTPAFSLLVETLRHRKAGLPRPDRDLTDRRHRRSVVHGAYIRARALRAMLLAVSTDLGPMGSVTRTIRLPFFAYRSAYSWKLGLTNASLPNSGNACAFL